MVLALPLITFLGEHNANAANFAVWDFTLQAGNEDNVPADSLDSVFASATVFRGPFPAGALYDDTIAGTAWPGTIFPDTYFEIELVAKPGVTYSISEIDFVTKSEEGGPSVWELKSSLDSFVTPLADFKTLANGTDETVAPITPSLGSLTWTTAFRLYEAAGEGAVGGLRSIQVKGEILSIEAAVPEVAPGAWVGILAAAAVISRQVGNRRSLARI